MNAVEITIRILALGVSFGAMATSAISLRRAPTPPLRWTGLLFCICAAAYAIKLIPAGPDLRAGHGDWIPMPYCLPLTALAVATPGVFLLFIRALFDDRCAMHPAAVAPAALLGTMGLAVSYGPAELHWLWLPSSLLSLGASGYGLALVIRGWKSDLVEARRRLRGPVLVAIGLYSVFTVSMEVWRGFRPEPVWYPLVNAVLLAGLSLAWTVLFVEARSDLFGAARPAALPASQTGQAVPAVAREPVMATVAALDRATQADLDRLEALMGRDQVWREEGLTIAGLALRAGMPETQLRRLINDHLGHRNFPSFVNARRIAAAKERLADPNEARTSVSAIAYDIGFGSLGPFNRAFREATGQSPTEWRRAALGLGVAEPGLSPISRPA